MRSSLAAPCGDSLRPEDFAGGSDEGPTGRTLRVKKAGKKPRTGAADRHSIVTDSPLVGFFSRREDVSAEVGLNFSADLGKRGKNYGSG
jgi:hypothetical protein